MIIWYWGIWVALQEGCGWGRWPSSRSAARWLWGWGRSACMEHSQHTSTVIIKKFYLHEPAELLATSVLIFVLLVGDDAWTLLFVLGPDEVLAVSGGGEAVVDCRKFFPVTLSTAAGTVQLLLDNQMHCKVWKASIESMLSGRKLKHTKCWLIRARKNCLAFLTMLHHPCTCNVCDVSS